MSLVVDQSTSYRKELLDLIQEQRIVVDACSLQPFKNMKVFKSSSASETVMMFADIDALYAGNKNVIFKISFVVKDQESDNSLDIERKIYKKTNELLIKKVTPNFVVAYKSFKCKNFTKILKELSDKNLKSVVRDLLRNMSVLADDVEDTLYNFNNIHMLMLERTRGVTFAEWMQSKYYSIDDWISVMFQTLYTIDRMNAAKIQHNDLHLGNIMIDKQKGGGKLIYFTDNNTYYVVNKKYLVKIFDFDLGILEGKTNTKLDGEMCERYGVCNKFNKKFDEFIFLSMLHHTIEQFENYTANNVLFSIHLFIERVATEKLLNTKWGFAHRLCKLKKPGKCTGPFKPSDDELLPIKDVLKDSLFEGNMYTLPDYDPCYLPPDHKDIYFSEKVNKAIVLEKLKNINEIKFS